jgi:hypothetical protein
MNSVFWGLMIVVGLHCYSPELWVQTHLLFIEHLPVLITPGDNWWYNMHHCCVILMGVVTDNVLKL